MLRCLDVKAATGRRKKVEIMAIFRVAKTRDYTVMSNYHLRDKNLTLKAKGLLSLILSLPEDWNYTTRGLAAICKEGVDSIGAALRELESAGYLSRHRLRDKSGRISDTDFYAWSEQAREMKKKCDRDVITLEEYVEWLKNS